MHLSHRSRFNLHKLRSKRLRNGENRTINNLPPPPLRLCPRLLTRSIMITACTFQFSIRTQNTAITQIAPLDTPRRFGDRLKGALRDSKVLSENGKRSVDQPIVDIEGSSFGVEIAVIENEEIFCTWRGESLDYVALTLWEEPDVAFVGAEYLVFSGV